MTDEREAIVAWLRKLGGDAAECLRSLQKKQTLDFAQTAEWESLVETFKNLADGIERGDHLTKESQ